MHILETDFFISEIPILQPSTNCLFLSLFIYPQPLVEPANVYLSLVICPKPKIRLFSYNPQPNLKSSTQFTPLNPLLICFTILPNLQTRPSDVLLNLGLCPKPKERLFSYNPRRTLQSSTHCLYFLLFTYAQRLLNPTDLS